jgi:hypothetical protein
MVGLMRTSMKKYLLLLFIPFIFAASIQDMHKAVIARGDGGDLDVCDDSNLIGYWALTADGDESCGTTALNLTVNGTISFTADGPDYEEGNTEYHYDTGGLGYDFDSGDGGSDLITTIARITPDAEAASEFYAGEYDAGTNERVWALRLTSGGSGDQIEANVGYSDGSSFIAKTHTENLTLDGNTSYWVMVQIDDTGATALVTIRIRTTAGSDVGLDIVDSSTGQDWDDADTPAFCIGSNDHTSPGSPWDGHVRNFMVFKDKLSEAEFEAIVDVYE